MTRVFPPLKVNHPLVESEDRCPSCKRPFFTGQRVVLVPVREPQMGFETIEALVLHATCALEGARTPVGVVRRIKDGDASPYPVEMEDGTEHTLKEAGYDS